MHFGIGHELEHDKRDLGTSGRKWMEASNLRLPMQTPSIKNIIILKIYSVSDNTRV